MKYGIWKCKRATSPNGEWLRDINGVAYNYDTRLLAENVLDAMMVAKEVDLTCTYLVRQIQ